jgi:GNAT superfamily N-acetyltransferase
VLEVRALRPEDGDGLIAAVMRMSEDSRYTRFFAPKRTFGEKDLDFFLNIDFVGHVALVALVDDGGGPHIVGGGRYIMSSPGTAEIAFGVDDAHQGQGIASTLMRHLAAIARSAGLDRFFAEVLPENRSMLKVFARSGLAMTTRHEDGVVHVDLALRAS